MYVDDSTYTNNGKQYRRVLLRNAYRVNGKVCHDTLANISKCSNQEIEAIKLALKHKGNLQILFNATEDVSTKQGRSVGAIWVLYQLARQLGVTRALGNHQQAKLSLWMLIASAMGYHSRLSVVRLAKQHAVCDILGLEAFNEDTLYEVLDWIDANQSKIEARLFSYRHADKPVQLFLYDVTSSYLEGVENELGTYGYNRDGKKGKMQIVYGLLTDQQGEPLGVEVFKGNTKDNHTVAVQIKKLCDRFVVRDIVFVGDRGMIKQAQIEQLNEVNFYYITAITKPQIESMLKTGVFQMELFDEQLHEVVHKNIRYIMHRNPLRAEDMRNTRQSKLRSLQALIEAKNDYLKAHKRASAEVALKEVLIKAGKLKLYSWVEICVNERHLAINIREEQLKEKQKLDGCYVIKSDVPEDKATKETLHERYKSLSEVEWAFRTMKTALLDARPIFVRTAAHTRAHVFILMLAYLLAYHLRRKWQDVEVTIEEGIEELASICAIEVNIRRTKYYNIPEPRSLGKTLLQKLSIELPHAIPNRNVTVDTRKKLVSERKIL